jgi:hypothetical protein
VPWIIDYDIALEHMKAAGFRCNYHNSGAFGFSDANVIHRGWVGPEDESIRPQVREMTRQIDAPYEENLARLAKRVWLEHFPCRIWAMPMSHWAYELQYGSRDWMPALIEQIGLDPGLLEGRNNAAAIEFNVDDAPLFAHFTQRLLEMLLGSDFMLVFLGRPILCTLHHHKQLWWSTKDAHVIEVLDALAARG